MGKAPQHGVFTTRSQIRACLVYHLGAEEKRGVASQRTFFSIGTVGNREVKAAHSGGTASGSKAAEETAGCEGIVTSPWTEVGCPKHTSQGVGGLHHQLCFNAQPWEGLGRKSCNTDARIARSLEPGNLPTCDVAKAACRILPVPRRGCLQFCLANFSAVEEVCWLTE